MVICQIRKGAAALTIDIFKNLRKIRPESVPGVHFPGGPLNTGWKLV